MKTLYTPIDFNNCKSRSKLPLQCYCCKQQFMATKHQIQKVLRLSGKVKLKYCSNSCKYRAMEVKIVELQCKQCNKTIVRMHSRIKKSKYHFCSSSCSATYNNKHKTYGTRRSKLEIWLEEKLINQYPNLEIHFNKKNAIKSELDIYIPSLNLAFEINGIFHYEPIYGIEKLDQIQANDILKSKACIDEKIDLYIIDTSSQKYFKESTSLIFLDIINIMIAKR